MTEQNRLTVAFIDAAPTAADRGWLEARAHLMTNDDRAETRFAPQRSFGRGSGDSQDMSRLMRIALRSLLAHVTPTRSAEPVLYEPGGKPYFDGGPAFSQSHSQTLGLIAVADQGPIGCDLEWRSNVALPDERIAAMAVAHRSMSWHDVGETSASAEDVGLGAWRLARRETAVSRDPLEIWVDLEARAKASGTGIFRLLHAHGVFGGHATSERLLLDAEPVLWRTALTLFAADRPGSDALAVGAASVVSEVEPNTMHLAGIRTFASAKL